MYKKWSAAGATLFVVGLLLVAPAGATDTWDLTAGPVVVSYTLDLTQAPDISVTGDWSQQGAVGLFSGGAGARMVGFLYDWDKPTVEPKLDNDDKFNMQEPAVSRWDESQYDIADCATGVVGSPIGSGSNYGVWFDRDGVDQWQAAMWGSVDGATYNTNGVYDVVLTFKQAATPGKGFVCATVNGIPTGFYSGGWDADGPDISPAGLSFAATPQQMRTMELVTTEGDDGIVISDVNVSGVATYTTAADCAASESFVPSTGGTVTLLVDAGHNYRVGARGTYYAGGTSQFDIRADAEYSQDAIQRANDDPWTKSVHNYETTEGGLLDLMIDGENVDWGDYSSTHAYSLDIVAGVSTVSFAFDVYDTYPVNNTGGLCVSVTDLGNIGTFEGFFSPVNNDEVNTAKAGQSIPVKWRLLDYNGLPISDPASFVSISSTAGVGICSGLPTDAIEVYSGTSGLEYLGDGYWQFNWKTPKTYFGQCRIMTLELADGSLHPVDFQFK